MSELQRLKATLDAISRSSKQASANLAQLGVGLNTQMSHVAAAIGGSAQHKDREVLESLTAAAHQLEAARHALDVAARTTADYGRSL